MAERVEQFKTTWKGGYDKDEVLQGYKDLQGDLYEEKHSLQTGIDLMKQEINDKTARVSELEERIARCNMELVNLRSNVRDNYQPYIDSYDAIGSQIFESRIYSDRVAKEAQEERARILDEALSEAKKIRDDAISEAGKTRDTAKSDTERQVAETEAQIERQEEINRRKYDAVQQELHMVLGDFSQIQRKFMRAYKSIHDVLTDDSGDLAQMRLEELTAQSPTVRIPDLATYLDRGMQAGQTAGIDKAGPTKDFTELHRALTQAAQEPEI